jgi:hypothetical protein
MSLKVITTVSKSETLRFSKTLASTYNSYVVKTQKKNLNIFTAVRTSNLTPLVCSQCQVDVIYFYPSSVFVRVPQAFLLQKLADYGLPAGYVNLFHCYLTNRLISRSPF